MTSGETAAWVSAGAAVLQAAGAVTAIFVTAQIARSSERRAAAAERAADDRARAAEEAASRRITSAAIDANNAALAEAVSNADAALAILEDLRDLWLAETRNSHFAGFEVPPTYGDIEKSLAACRLDDIRAPKGKRAVRELMRALDWRARERRQSGNPVPAVEMAKMFEAWIVEVRPLRDQVAQEIIPPREGAS